MAYEYVGLGAGGTLGAGRTPLPDGTDPGGADITSGGDLLRRLMYPNGIVPITSDRTGGLILQSAPTDLAVPASGGGGSSAPPPQAPADSSSSGSAPSPGWFESSTWGIPNWLLVAGPAAFLLFAVGGHHGK